MIYLIESAAFAEDGGFKKLLKIGYADSMQLRYTQYKLHNPTCRILKQLEGTKLDEIKLHYHFRKYKYTSYGNEWYEYVPEILDYFDSEPNFSLLEECPKMSVSFKTHLEKKVIEYFDKYFLMFVFDWSSGGDNIIEEREKLKEKEAYVLNLVGHTICSESDITNYMFDIFSFSDDKFVKRNTDIPEVNKYLKKFRKFKTFPEKLKLMCESDLEPEFQTKFLERVPMKYVRIYLQLGPDRCKAYSYRQSLLEQEILDTTNNANIKNIIESEILSRFNIGDRLKKIDIKNILREIYEKYGYTKTPKATDLEEYFELKRCKITESGETFEGFLLQTK